MVLTDLTSVLLVVEVLVLRVTGHMHASLTMLAAEVLMITEQNLEWVTCLVDSGTQEVYSVTATVDLIFLLLHHLLVLTSLQTKTSVGFVVDAGLYHTDMVDRVL